MGDVVPLFSLDGAEFDGPYRYRLWRAWDEGADRLLGVLLNPSKAGTTDDDPTTRKFMGFARRFGFGSIELVNLYAFCATQPRVLHAAIKQHGERYAVGPRNDAEIVAACGRAKTVFAGWGAKKFAEERAAAVKQLLRDNHQNVLCLGKTEGGQPRHPLYLPYDTVPEVFA